MKEVEGRQRVMISEVRDTVKKFLMETFETEGVRIITIDQVGDGWIAEAEVTEMNRYLATVKPEYHVFEKEHYVIKLNAALEVSSYKCGKIAEGVF
ncbi:MAG TPA: hypothetical protein VNG51_04880 [Ktedonobacteraceae bacterium]|nr:hypothetical protein [Ktedonobacteraceae bacterium]